MVVETCCAAQKAILNIEGRGSFKSPERRTPLTPRNNELEFKYAFGGFPSPWLGMPSL